MNTKKQGLTKEMYMYFEESGCNVEPTIRMIANELISNDTFNRIFECLLSPDNYHPHLEMDTVTITEVSKRASVQSKGSYHIEHEFAITIRFNDYLRPGSVDKLVARLKQEFSKETT